MIVITIGMIYGGLIKTSVGTPVLYMQGDGNLVVYANGNTSVPLLHSDTWCRYTDQNVTQNPKCSYPFKLTNNGALQIIRSYNGNSTIFDSTMKNSRYIKNKMIKAAY